MKIFHSEVLRCERYPELVPVTTMIQVNHENSEHLQDWRNLSRERNYFLLDFN